MALETDPPKSGKWIWPVVVLLLIFSGATYRSVAGYLQGINENIITLPMALNEFPMEIGQWIGKEVPIPINIQEVAKNDDFLSRIYIKRGTNQWINIYIAFTARPRTMIGHQPQICYPAQGWILNRTDQAVEFSNSGLEIPCLLHRFHLPVPEYEELVVLNFYIVNGRLTDDESVFSGVGWRTPNIAGDPARYVAQVQLSSVSENSVRSATRDFSNLILDYLPDQNGIVKAAELGKSGEENEF
ncbi:MAG: exosortase-associated EpsI family protein [Sedimentisphaerales bacterium]|nr:exosortase-associated EpsI family protein [Sedimentisphaerales bacterium]